MIVANGDDRAAHAVGVTVQELRRAVNHEVGAEIDGPLHVRAGKRIVDCHGDAVAVRNRAGASEVGQPQHRVRGRLDEQQLGRRLDGAFDLNELRGIGVREVELILAQHLFEQPIGSAIGVVGHHDVVA